MRETRTLEFKEAITNTFLKTVSAYANYGSGKVVFGIADDGTISGIDDIKETCLAIENKINDSLEPVPRYSIEPNFKNKTITLFVEEGPNKPYCYKSKAYIRNDSATVEVDRLEYGRLVLLGQNLTFDKLPTHSASLTFETLGRQIEQKMGISQVSDDVLKTLELESPQGQFNIAAELLSDKNTFPGIDIARFGETINIFKERVTFEKESVLLQYDHALDIYKRYYQYESIDGALRTTHDIIPEKAFREAIANALVHRQWDTRAHIRVSMFDDRVEIVSPGGLVHGLTEREYLEGQTSILRNPILGNVFFRLEIIERFGTGVLRIKECYRESVVQPGFDIFDNSIKITLPIFQSTLDLPNDDALVYNIVKGCTMSISEIAKLAGFGKSKTHDILKRLVGSGFVEIIGTGRGTKYKSV